jgi:hypothetical protein
MAKSKKKPAASTRAAKASTTTTTSTVANNNLENATPADAATSTVTASQETTAAPVSMPESIIPAESFDDQTPVSPIATEERNGGNGSNGSEPTIDQIRRRAYEIYLERGGAPGNPLEDWSRAERELRGW